MGCCILMMPVQAGEIDKEVALQYASSVTDLGLKLEGF